MSEKGPFCKSLLRKEDQQEQSFGCSLVSQTCHGGCPESLSKSLETVTIEGLEVKALFDSGSTESFIHPRLVEKV